MATSRTARQAGAVAEKLRLSLAEPYILSVQHEGMPDTTVEHHCTASVGVSMFTNHEASQEDILKWADAAMYQATRQGKDCIVLV